MVRCEVLRAFRPTDEIVEPGTIVETDGWRAANVARLIEWRYLRVLPEPEPATHAEELSAQGSPERQPAFGSRPRGGRAR